MKPLDPCALNVACRAAVEAAGLKKRATVRSLRHALRISVPCSSKCVDRVDRQRKRLESRSRPRINLQILKQSLTFSAFAKRVQSCFGARILCVHQKPLSGYRPVRVLIYSLPCGSSFEVATARRSGNPLAR
jgi:hypothetical protein